MTDTPSGLSEEERARRHAEYLAGIEADCAPYGGAVDPENRLTWAGLARHAHAREAAGLALDDRHREALDRYPVCPQLDGTVAS